MRTFLLFLILVLLTPIYANAFTCSYDLELTSYDASSGFPDFSGAEYKAFGKAYIDFGDITIFEEMKVPVFNLNYQIDFLGNMIEGTAQFFHGVFYDCYVGEFLGASFGADDFGLWDTYAYEPEGLLVELQSVDQFSLQGGHRMSSPEDWPLFEYEDVEYAFSSLDFSHRSLVAVPEPNAAFFLTLSLVLVIIYSSKKSYSKQRMV